MLRLILLLMLAVPAAAASPQWAMPVLADGLAAHARGDHARARADFRRLAAQGSAVAETMLGAMAARGEGRRPDPAEAAAWWLRAANRGYAPAQVALAEALATGRGIRRDPGAAWLWARLAATHGEGATVTRARAVAAELARGLSPAELAELDRRRLAWRPWATLR